MRRLRCHKVQTQQLYPISDSRLALPAARPRRGSRLTRVPWQWAPPTTLILGSSRGRRASRAGDGGGGLATRKRSPVLTSSSPRPRAHSAPGVLVDARRVLARAERLGAGSVGGGVQTECLSANS